MQLTQPLPVTFGKVEIFHISQPLEYTIRMSFIPPRNFYKLCNGMSCTFFVITLKCCPKLLRGKGGGGGGGGRGFKI